MAKMKINRIILFFGLTLWMTQISFAQSSQQREELNQINSDIEKSYRRLAKSYAYSAVYDFFIQRVKYIHQTNEKCLSMFDQIKSLSGELSQPNLFNENYSSPEQAYAALEILTSLVLNDQVVLTQMKTLQDEFNLQKKNINETEILLNSSDETIATRFPRPSDLNQDYEYKTHLISEYHKVSEKYRTQVAYFISKCGTAELHLNEQIQKRTAFFSDFAKKLGDYYVENATEKYAYKLGELAKPRSDISLLLNVESALDLLDRKYRDAALYEKDYLKSLSFINAYESIAFIILTRVLPLGENNNERTEAQNQINQRVQKANDFKKILNKQKPSDWLQQRHELIKTKIQTGKIACDLKCNRNIDETEKLISAAKILEIESTESIYIVLGNQALDAIQ